MASSIIMVEMGEGAVHAAPTILQTSWIGSCVAAALYDTRWRIGALAHIMFPNAQYACSVQSPYQCAELAIAAMLRELRHHGSKNGDVVAKIAGGAGMFPAYHGKTTGLGATNIVSVKRQLERHRVPLVGEDTGGSHGRCVEFDLVSGILVVSSVDRKDVKL